MTNMNTMINDCIGANLVLLERRLWSATITARSARDAMRNGQRNLAIGTALPLERELHVATALYQTIIALHRMPAETITQTARDGGAPCL